MILVVFADFEGFDEFKPVWVGVWTRINGCFDENNRLFCQKCPLSDT